MEFNIDTVIFSVFLIINLTVGLSYGKGITTIKEYAVGNRNFSTATIAATLVATWISGSFFTMSVSETYREGLWFFFAAMGEIVALSVTAIFLAPRVKEFFENLSVAEVMGGLYGKKIRIVTAICSMAQAVGMTAMQIKVFSTIFSHFLGMSSIAGTLVSSMIVITYATVGGIRAVTFTDVVQFLTFGLCMPILAIFVWQAFGDVVLIKEVFATNPVFDFRELLNYNNAKFFPNLFLFFYFAIPGLNSTMFQRILMAKSAHQVRQSYLVAALVCFFVHTLACFIGLVVLSHNPTLSPNNVALYVIDNYSFAGLKWLAIVGIMAMIMSTADSWINTGSVIFAHDFCKPLGFKVKNELLLSRVFAAFAGCFAVILALSAADLLKLLLLQGKFYKPIVLPPLLFAVLGFRSTTKAVGAGMIAGGASVILWLNVITPATGIDGIIPSTVTNLIVFMGIHYLFKQPGGWIKRQGASAISNKPRRTNFRTIKEFSVDALISYCNKYTPKNERVYLYFAFATLFSIVITSTLDKQIYMHSFAVINQLQSIMLLIATIFFCNKLWPSEFRERYIGLVWQISIFISLAFGSSFLTLMSNFSHASLIIFILNLTMIGVLLNWQNAIIMSILGVFSAYLLYWQCAAAGAMPELSTETYDLKLKALYILLMIGGFTLAFLKPKQEYQEITELKADYFLNKSECQKEEISKAQEMKHEFLRNLQHEARTPITGITAMGQLLWERYDRLDEKQRRLAAQTIAESSERLVRLVDNLIDLSSLMQDEFNLNIQNVNLSELLHTRIDLCKALYITEPQKDKRQIILAIQDDVMASCDEHYICGVFDSVIINALQYCKLGNIAIALRNTSKGIEFSVVDEGIGVPLSELYDIFSAFTVSSKTKTPSGGRGIGLALAKRVIEVHGGKIWVESDGKKGAKFVMTLPK